MGSRFLCAVRVSTVPSFHPFVTRSRDVRGCPLRITTWLSKPQTHFFGPHCSRPCKKELAHRKAKLTGMSLSRKSRNFSLNRAAIDWSRVSMRLADKSRVSNLFSCPIPAGHWSRSIPFSRRCFILRRPETSGVQPFIGLLDTL